MLALPRSQLGCTLIHKQPIESADIQAEQLRRLLAADVEATADLQDETVDQTTATANYRVGAIDYAALRVEATASVDSDARSASGTSMAGPSTIDDLALATIAKERALGFFAFVATLIVIFTTQWDTDLSLSKTEVMSAATSLTNEANVRRIRAGGTSTDSREAEKPAETRATQTAEGKRESARASVTHGVVAFESRSFTTSEKALAAVFIVKRTQAVRGRAFVQWAAHSGSADAAIDFSDASGTVRFADGQRQLAIYVPLRNDLLREEDETFSVCLRSPRQARIGGMSCAEATIRDDDAVSQI
jgi:hypothetical protein